MEVQNSDVKRCAWCQTEQTSLWRRGVMLCNACGIRYARGHSPKAAKPVKRAGGAKHQPKARVHAHHDESEADMEIDAPEILPLKHINASDFLIEDIQEEEGKADGDKDDTYNERKTVKKRRAHGNNTSSLIMGLTIDDSLPYTTAIKIDDPEKQKELDALQMGLAEQDRQIDDLKRQIVVEVDKRNCDIDKLHDTYSAEITALQNEIADEERKCSRADTLRRAVLRATESELNLLKVELAESEKTRRRVERVVIALEKRLAIEVVAK